MTEKERKRFLQNKKATRYSTTPKNSMVIKNNINRDNKYIGKRYKETSYGNNSDSMGSSSLSFRTYIAIVLTGAIFSLSLIQSEDSSLVCATLKNVISQELPTNQVNIVMSYIDDILEKSNLSIYTFKEIEENIEAKTETNTETKIETTIEDDNINKEEKVTTMTSQENIRYYPDINNYNSP